MQPLISTKLPSPEVETQWSSISNMIRFSYNFQSRSNTITTTIQYSRRYLTDNSLWNESATISRFLESPASLTQCQFVSIHFTLTLTVTTYYILLLQCTNTLEANANVFKPFSKAMFLKINKYETITYSDKKMLFLVLNSCFTNDIFQNGNILHRDENVQSLKSSASARDACSTTLI